MAAARSQKNYGRSFPRLKYEDGDRRAIRFRSSRPGRIVQSRLYDISASGVALLVAAKLAPRIGEIINMDFAPIGSMQMACSGRVVRIEEPNGQAWHRFSDTVKVGIAFYNLPDTYSRMLVKALGDAIEYGEALQDHAKRGPSFDFDFSKQYRWFENNIWSIITSLVIVTVASWGFYTIINNAEENKHTVDAPWASGFFEKVIKKDK